MPSSVGSEVPEAGSVDPGKKQRWNWKLFAFFVFVLACVVVAIVVPVVLLSGSVTETKEPQTQERIPCLLGQSPSPESCEAAGCFFYSAGDADLGTTCYFPNKYGLGYEVAESVADTDTGIKLSLKRLAETKSVYGNDAETVEFEAKYYSDNVVGIQLRDPANVYSRPPPAVQLNLPTPAPSNNRKYDVTVNKDAKGESLTVVIKRKGTEQILFDTSFTGMIVSKQYLQWATKLPSDRLFGIGESNRPRFKHDMNYKTWALSARDQPPGGTENLYGVHPFFMAFDEAGNAHGVLFFNSHIMEVTTLPLPGLVFRSIGGALDFLIFSGPKAEDVVSQYLNVIGKPMLPAYWGLGFQLSRYGYDTLENMERAIARTRKYGIPQDVQHMDIDYMDRNLDFTYDRVNFAGLPEFINESKAIGLKFITMIHPAISSNETEANYALFEEGRRAGVYVTWKNATHASEGQDLDQADGKIMLGYLWPPGKAAFPDFFKNSTKEWWIKQIKDFHETIAFDGIWTDMNEPANFGTNEEKPFNWPEGEQAWSLICPDEDWENPPYSTRAATAGPTNRISDKTLCMTAALGEDKEFLFYEVHNLYGWSQAESTFRASADLASTTEKKRSAIITRSTYPGSGKYAGHWLGDNTSKYEFIRYSIVGILDFNIFGVPYVGCDICGFFDNATEHMCGRWMVNGAFYPFSRNHNGKNNIDQDPGVWPSVAKASKNALMTRYTLLPYLYNLFFRAHKDGRTVVRPLHHEFSNDAAAYDVDTQFMWGDALMFAPYYDADLSPVRDLYLPEAVWYNYKTGDRMAESGAFLVSSTEEEPVIFVRGGRIVPTQRPAPNTALSRQNPMGLIVALSEMGTAEGTFFWDSGDEYDPLASRKYFDLHMMFSGGSLQFHSVVRNASLDLNPVMSDLRILGVASSPLPLRLSVNGQAWNRGDWHYNSETKELDFFDLDIPIRTLNEIKWVTVADELAVECPVSYKVRLDNGSIPQAECESVGCTWNPGSPNLPSCAVPAEHKHVYVIGDEGVMNMSNGKGIMIHLKKQDDFALHGPNFDEINFHIFYLDNKSLRFNFVVPGETRYVPPVPLNQPTGEFDPAMNEYEAVIADPTPGAAFHFHIRRKSNGAILFDTSIGGFAYSDQFLSISTLLPSRNIYGMGENMHASFRHDMSFQTWPAFGRDQPPSSGNEDGAKNLNLYGSHPFYECVENDGNTHGVFLFSASALDYQLLPYPGITYRTISGMLDFYIFLGPKPEEVVSQYTSLIGRPTLVPYWSLGFQLSKYGYENLDTLKAAVQRTIDNDIPLDVQYLDIDHMDNQADFTIDTINFAEVKEYIAETKAFGLKWIPILDPAIDTEKSGYNVHANALAADVYWKWPDASYVAEGTQYFTDYLRLGNSTTMLGYVWPVGKAAFPNFFEPATEQWWHNEIMQWKQHIDFDGLWIDMNEPASFDTNKKRPWNWGAQRPGEPDWNLVCPVNKWDDPPYVTMAALWTGCEGEDQTLCSRRMSDKTMCLFAVYGNETHFIRHYDTHNLYGWAETPITKKAAEDATGGRSLVLTRATFPSSGTKAGHWLGDNASIWPDLHRSVIGMLEFSLFGMPYIGADICGFFYNTTESMCNRWMQLGAFYTFSRNHNTYEGRPLPQDPGVWPGSNSVAEASRRALRIRYRFLPYLYTLFFDAHIKGSTVVRPLHHEFPADRNALGVDSQFLWGPAFMVSPILEEDALTRTAYLPDDLWYDYHTKTYEPFTGVTIEIEPRDNLTVPIHLRGGYIFPVQSPEGKNTHDTRNNPMGLIITVGRSRTASGSLYWDDGNIIDPLGTGKYHHSRFTFTEVSINNTVAHQDVSNSVFGGVKLENIEIWGYEYELKSITVDGLALTNVIIEQDLEVVKISGLKLDFSQNFLIDLIRE